MPKGSIPLSTPATWSARHKSYKEPTQSSRDLLLSPAASQLVTKFPTVTKPEGALQCSLETATELLLDSVLNQLNAEHVLALHLQKILFNTSFAYP